MGTVLAAGDRPGQATAHLASKVSTELAQALDPRLQLEAFLVPISKGARPVGRSWADSVGSQTTAQVGTWLRIQAVRRFRARGGTVAVECRCALIERESSLTLEIRGPGPTPDRTTRTPYTHAELDVVLWDSAGGWLVARMRSAQLSGTLQMLGGEVEMRTAIRRRYHSVILLDPDG